MSNLNLIKDLFLVVVVASLLLIGGGIALRSGVVVAGRDRLGVVGSLSRLVVLLAGYAVVLLLVQSIIGFKTGMP